MLKSSESISVPVTFPRRPGKCGRDGIFAETMSGQAASYYDGGQNFADSGQAAGYEKRNANYPTAYNPQQNGAYQPPANYGGPVTYGQPGPGMNPQQPPYPDNPPPYTTFDEAFKIQKPKYNDIWAGLLVSESFNFNFRWSTFHLQPLCEREAAKEIVQCQVKQDQQNLY